MDENDPEAVMIPFSADFESRFVEMASDEEREACLKENPGCSSMLDRIIKAGYKALQLIYFFTAGNDEVKAWTIQVSPVDLTAPLSLFVNLWQAYLLCYISNTMLEIIDTIFEWIINDLFLSIII